MNLFLDLETLPDQREGAQDKASELVKVPANYKKPETIEQYKRDHAEEAYRKTALHGIAGEICSIAWAIDGLDIECICRTESMSESELLKAFFEAVSGCALDSYGGHRRVTWIAHNAEFDLRFLKQRSLINQVRPSLSIPADARHGNGMFDTMKEWAGWKGYVKQDSLYAALGGLPYKDDSMDGSKVWDVWQAGEFETIRKYNIRDVEKLRHNYNRMVWKQS